MSKFFNYNVYMFTIFLRIDWWNGIASRFSMWQLPGILRCFLQVQTGTLSLRIGQRAISKFFKHLYHSSSCAVIIIIIGKKLGNVIFYCQQWFNLPYICHSLWCLNGLFDINDINDMNIICHLWQLSSMFEI